MKRPTSIYLLAIGFAALAATVSCMDPADPVDYGELCLPATDSCPDHAELRRGFVGRNALEFTIRAGAAGQSTAVVRVVTDRELSLPDPRETTDEGATILFEEEYPLGDEEILSQQLTSFHLAVVPDLRIELECIDGICDHRLEYLYLVDSLECVENEGCGRNQFCEVEYGRCAECDDDEQCGSGGSCNRETGFCAVGESAGCTAASTNGGFPAKSGLLFIMAVLALLAISSIRRRRPIVAVVLSAAALVVATPTVASADTGASMHIGGGVRVLTGDAGDLTHPGWGITVSQQLRWHRVGTNFELSTNSFGLTDEAAIERGQLTGYGISLSPQVYFPIPVEVPNIEAERPLEAITSFGYTRWSVAENRIARVTGLDLNYHAIGPTLGLRFRWNDLEFTSTARYLHIFDWPGSLFSVDVTIGFNP